MIGLVRRLLARARKGGVQMRGYSAGRTPGGREMWRPPSGGPNSALGLDWATIADRARDAVRNDPYAARIVDVWVGNLVGAGVTTRWTGGGAVEAAWKAWTGSRECDASGVQNWLGLQVLLMRTVVESGEALVIAETAPVTDANPLGLALRVIEGDHLDRSVDGGREGGNYAVQGVEFSAAGRPVAYHLRPISPTGTVVIAPQLVRRIPADRVLHVYRQLRPGQVRGVSWLAPILWRLRDLATYEAALLRKAQVEAMLALIVTGEEEDTVTGDAATAAVSHLLTDSHGRALEGLEPGLIAYRRSAGEIETVNPTGGGSHQDFAARALEAAAVGTGLTYDQVSGNLTRANYSSLRAGKIEFRRLLEQVQYSILIGQFVGRVAERFAARGVALNLWPAPAGVVHTPSAPEMVDPMKDTAALIAQVRAGFVPLPEAAGSFGYDFTENVNAIAEANTALDGRGIILDTDPRRTARGGGAQDATQNAAVELNAADGGQA